MHLNRKSDEKVLCHQQQDEVAACLHIGVVIITPGPTALVAARPTPGTLYSSAPFNLLSDEETRPLPHSTEEKAEAWRGWHENTPSTLPTGSLTPAMPNGPSAIISPIAQMSKLRTTKGD